ncbi:MAG TPA: DUF3617 family protein [Thermodesulfovibrionales bacterium]|nr:DUF3617 family protein [Thermodesulfovibrionales bacterium]
MSYRIIFVVAIAAGLLSAAVAFGEPNMEEGKWEMTMKTEMPGMPMEMPPTKYTQCLTKKDMVPQKKEKNEDCKMISSKVEGNTVTWVMQCKTKGGTVDSTGKITYKGNSFEGVVKTTMKESGDEQIEVTGRMSGKRIGDCK